MTVVICMFNSASLKN